MTKQVNLTETLDKLNEIANWFDQQTQVDVEEGLKKVKEAAVLIKESKARLGEIENEFAEIKADIQEIDGEFGSVEHAEEVTVIEETTVSATTDSSEDIPF